ncbi:MAG: hypothetical protein H0W01_07445, partial [Pseudonocardiales bacterium]|nr:hypothetical protein [Pseudonocardiales bacterium]
MLAGGACTAAAPSASSNTGTTKVPGYPIVDPQQLGARFDFVELLGAVPGGVQVGCSGIAGDDVSPLLDHLGREKVVYNFTRDGKQIEVYVRPSPAPNEPPRLDGPGGTFPSSEVERDVRQATRVVGRDEWLKWARSAARRQRLVGCVIRG